MVRGSNVDGYNLVPDWLRDGFVSLSASQLGGLDPGADYDELRQAVEAGYQHKSYAYRGQRLEEFDRFLRRMREGDLVLTPMRGGVYLGEVCGPAHLAESAASHSNLRRSVKWFNPAEPIDGEPVAARRPVFFSLAAYTSARYRPAQIRGVSRRRTPTSVAPSDGSTRLSPSMAASSAPVPALSAESGLHR